MDYGVLPFGKFKTVRKELDPSGVMVEGMFGQYGGSHLFNYRS